MSVYTVRVVGDGSTSVGHGSTKYTTSPCLFVQQVNVPATSYTIFVASINGDGEESSENNTTVNSKDTQCNYLNQVVTMMVHCCCMCMCSVIFPCSML